MAIRTDWILVVIERLAKAIAAWAKNGDDTPVNEALVDLCGLGLDRLDRMPSWALVRLIQTGDRVSERRTAIADALEMLAQHGPEDVRSNRLAKARALRQTD